jgi:hypothetical protein
MDINKYAVKSRNHNVNKRKINDVSISETLFVSKMLLS